ncbi:MAG: hypothetical protein K1X72_15930 [Pyrinomonadaceae bacterium]|nr:hypothetical protein [Pyrinomonadaceae bacterium]
MVKKTITFSLILLVLNLFGAGVILPQQNDKNVKQIEEVKAKVAKIGTGEKAKVKVELNDKTKFKGYISIIEPDSFSIIEKVSGKSNKIEYGQVKKVGRDGMTLGSKIAIGVGAAGAAVALALFFSYYCNEQAC